MKAGTLTARVYQWFCYNFSRIQKKIFIIWNHLVSYTGDFLSIKGLKAKPKICDQQCLAHIESYQMIKRKMDEWNISPPLSNSLILCNEKKIVECLILQKPFILIIKKQKISLPCCLPSMIEYSQLIGELKQKNFKRFYKCQVVILKKKKDNWTFNKLTAFVFQKFANSLRASL